MRAKKRALQNVSDEIIEPEFVGLRERDSSAAFVIFPFDYKTKRHSDVTVVLSHTHTHTEIIVIFFVHAVPHSLHSNLAAFIHSFQATN